MYGPFIVKSRFKTNDLWDHNRVITVFNCWLMVQKVRRKVDKCFNQNINIFVRKAFE